MRLLALLLLGLSSLLVQAAALVPLPSPKQLASVSEIQPNKGQAASGILFQTRGVVSIAAQGASLLFSPIGGHQNFVAGNSSPQVSFSDPLPGVSHDYSTANSTRWITNIPRYATAHLAAIYPGIDVEYNLDPTGQLTLRLLLAPNADLNQVIFELPEVANLRIDPSTKLVIAQFIQYRFGPTATYGPAVSSTTINVEQLTSKTFRFTAPLRDPGSALRIDIPLGAGTYFGFPSSTNFTSDSQSNFWTAVAVPDAAGKPDPFPTMDGNGCGLNTGNPFVCNDVAVYKVSPAGEVISVTYLSGGVNEMPGFLGFAPDQSVFVTGDTSSTDFPVSSTAYQSAFAGPPGAGAVISGGTDPGGDYFAAKLDPATGMLLASTYLGGPNTDTFNATVIGSDGSLNFMRKSRGFDMIGMPTTPGALMRDCADTGTGSSATRCSNGYVAHLSSNLDQLIFGTYVPGAIDATMRLHSDGSVYFAGINSPSFQPTPGAYQQTINGPKDAIVGRLDPTGSRLLFATYLGGPAYDTIRSNAVTPDGSVWVTVASYDPCCSNDEYRLIHLDAEGKNKLVDLPFYIGDITTNQNGDLLAITQDPHTPSANAFMTNGCPYYGLGYARISADGSLLFFTYLPQSSQTNFDGIGPHGLPIVTLNAVLQGSNRFEIIEGQDMGILAGCMVNAASYTVGDRFSHGEIVTIFGSKLGPNNGVAFSLESGHLPTSLGDMQVLVNNQPIPLLYVSSSQINAILPFDLQPLSHPEMVVTTSNGAATSNLLPASYVADASLSLFSLDGSGQGQAAAINEDGSVNSPQHRAKPGSRVLLFGTGGGQTNPSSTAGEVTPLEIRWLVNSIALSAGKIPLDVEFEGAAPGLVSGVNQINIKLPDPMPKIDGYPSGTLPIGNVTISVTGN